MGKQRVKGFKYFDVLFGFEGQSEATDEKGQKSRPHIAFFPDGNGKFVRLSDYNCELQSILAYDPSKKDISPSRLEIYLKDHSEKIVMNFEFNSDKKKVILMDAKFE